MAKADPYTPVVAARTRAAQTILSNKDLRTSYEGVGGLPEDLEHIVFAGQRAEAANLGQSIAVADKEGDTATVLTSFDRLRVEYTSVMGVVSAVKGELVRNKASGEIVKTIERIIKNEVPVRIVAVTSKTGEARKVARKVESLEAMRAEIQKDALALLEVKEIAASLARRKVTALRLKAMAKEAEGLTGRLGERSVSKGAAKAATAVEHEAVKAQKDAWGAAYRLLSQLGREDARVAQLLSEAARPRPKTTTK